MEGRDTICVAPTGSGKTLAYVLPTIVKLGHPARHLKGRQDGLGVRAVVMVPTHDLAMQIHAVVKAVIRGRAWRCLILTKATEKAVCDSSPGNTAFEVEVEGDGQGEEERDGSETDGVLDEDDVEEVDERDSDTQPGPEAPSLGKSSLGIDILIATPERLHHLVETERLSLARYAYTTSDVRHC